MDHISETSVAIVVDVTLEWIINILAEEISNFDDCDTTISNCPITFSTVDDNTSSDTNSPNIIYSLFVLPLVVIVQSRLNRKN